MSRRTVLRGMGVTMALPLLDAMVPAATALRKTAAPARSACRHRDGARRGRRDRSSASAKNLWSPAAVGHALRPEPDRLTPLEPFRDYLTIVSNTDVRNAEAFSCRKSAAITSARARCS